MFSPSPVVGQEKPLPMRTHVPETEESESDASDEPGPKEDPPDLMARLPSDLEGGRGVGSGGGTIGPIRVGYP